MSPLVVLLLAFRGPRQITLHNSFSDAKKEHKPKLLTPDFFSGGMGVFHVEGWGPKSSGCPSKSGKSNFWWDIPAVPEKFEKNKCAFNLGPFFLPERI